LTQAIVELASQYGRHGYRQVTGLLRNDGWRVIFHRATIVLPQPASEFLSKAVGGPIPYFQWIEKPQSGLLSCFSLIDHFFSRIFAKIDEFEAAKGLVRM
jgi:hypothetical protein